MSRKQRTESGFGLSFMDVICCGFGAIILLLLITETRTRDTDQRNRISLESEEEIAEFLAAKAQLDKSMQALEAIAAANERQRSRKAADVESLKAELAKLKALLAVVQTEQQAQRRLSGISETEVSSRPIDPVKAIAGVPLDAEHVIFVIDTSGSMVTAAWLKMLKIMEQVLNVYPEVEGLQVMSDMGGYLYPSQARKWLADNQRTRREIFTRLRTWREFSNSSPVEGIRTALQHYRRTQSNIAIYILGDDFHGGHIEATLDEVDRLNRATGSTGRKIRIHAIGFPVHEERFQVNPKFAALMRELTFRNEGAFLGLSTLKL